MEKLDTDRPWLNLTKLFQTKSTLFTTECAGGVMVMSAKMELAGQVQTLAKTVVFILGKAQISCYFSILWVRW